MDRTAMALRKWADEEQSSASKDHEGNARLLRDAANQIERLRHERKETLAAAVDNILELSERCARLEDAAKQSAAFIDSTLEEGRHAIPIRIIEALMEVSALLRRRAAGVAAELPEAKP